MIVNRCTSKRTNYWVNEAEKTTNEHCTTNLATE